ncbi:LysR family transcriptional regulator [Kerstersia sp.]|uniref:LysR family transcriptional regulator n=1 Tax=Kerstersia sp. TaxID=1930783 RepID=UPI003F916429
MENANPKPLLDAKLLLLFIALHHTGSVSRAADQLGQNQPTVSMWLARLRAYFDDELFVRTGGTMVPTARAETLLGPVREALAALQRLEQQPERVVPAQMERRFTVCMTDASHMTLLPQLLTLLRRDAPGVSLDVEPIEAETPARLAAGLADLALGIIPGLESGFYQQTFYTQSFVCLAGSHWHDGSALTLADYQAAAHIEVLSGRTHSLLDSALRSQRIQRRVALRLPGFLGVANIVANTDLLATVPSQIGRRLGSTSGVRLLHCPFETSMFTVKQYWHARMHNEPAHRWLRQQCALLYRTQELGVVYDD